MAQPPGPVITLGVGIMALVSVGLPVLAIALAIAGLVLSNRLFRVAKAEGTKVSGLTVTARILSILALVSTTTLMVLAFPIAMGW
jgi:hypothetical protein